MAVIDTPTASAQLKAGKYEFYCPVDGHKQAGMEGKLTERDQAGHTVYRVRVGPFDRKSDADAAKEKLADAGIEAALVRVQR